MRLRTVVVSLATACGFNTGGVGEGSAGGPGDGGPGTAGPTTGGVSTTQSGADGVGDLDLAGSEPTVGTTGEVMQWAWVRRIDFEVEAGVVLDDFPVRVRLDGTRIEFAETLADGADLRFVAADRNTRLAFEIETWVQGASAEIWVGVPRIDELNDHMFMVYGNPDATDAQDPPGVWPPTTVGVYHLADAADSSESANHGTPTGTSSIAGRVGSGMHFNSAAVDLPVGILGTGAGTISVWIQGLDEAQMFSLAGIVFGSSIATADGFGGEPELYVSAVDRADYALQFIHPNNDMGGGYMNIEEGTMPWLDGQWHHLVAVWAQGGDAVFYIDGEQIGSQPMVGPMFDFTGVLRLGNTGANSRYFVGNLDEVRLHDQPVDAAWVAAQYRSQADTLLIFGPPEPID